MRITQVDVDAQVRALMAILKVDNEGLTNRKAAVQPVAQDKGDNEFGEIGEYHTNR